MTKDHRKENTRQAILKAMVSCLEKENFNDITTTKLAQAAGISRSSFYTHYKDKYEMIDSYQKEFFRALENIFTQQENSRAKALLKMFVLLEDEELLSALLSPNGTQEIQSFIIRKIKLFIENDLLLTQDLSPIQAEYHSIYFSHAIFGICQSWIIKGKRESPAEMSDFLMHLLP
ncbi:transcriptional regulator [Streptococcus varani]|uniref:Transcriptional regulator n=1 Tax=Streptococcus varani TaxID=1608583 RepID=A0A0E4H4J9_9STRE|nr:TetR/AcrR family transcriptional regulator [Streptococcus varani]CQR24298.1 transcriptional regulator [Streptococcus varani]